jgi:hypothetical protein
VRIIAATPGDISALTMPLTFAPGSSDGAEVCTSVTASDDNLVECDEELTIMLSLVTTGARLSLGNNATSVTVSDNDGMNDSLPY